MIEKNMAQPLEMIASDGNIENGKGHPPRRRTYARVLGRYARERKTLSLMDAIRESSLMPAQRRQPCPPPAGTRAESRKAPTLTSRSLTPPTITDRPTFEKPTSRRKASLSSSSMAR